MSRCCARLVDPRLQGLLGDRRAARPRSRSSRSSAFATVPAATCTAVCRADARSSAFRTSSWPYFRTPARSAWPGTRQRHGLRSLARRLALGRPRRHPPRPVLVVDVADDERERRAERPAVAEAGEHLDAVLLDLLAGRAAVALLPPLQVGVDPVAVELEPGRQAADDRHERRPVDSLRPMRARASCRASVRRGASRRREARRPVHSEARRALPHERLEAVDRPRSPSARAAATSAVSSAPVGEVDDRLPGRRLDEQLRRARASR